MALELGGVQVGKKFCYAGVVNRGTDEVMALEVQIFRWLLRVFGRNLDFSVVFSRAECPEPSFLQQRTRTSGRSSTGMHGNARKRTQMSTAMFFAPANYD